MSLNIFINYILIKKRSFIIDILRVLTIVNVCRLVFTNFVIVFASFVISIAKFDYRFFKTEAAIQRCSVEKVFLKIL